ncbi:MAG: flippase-like domain-containing protein, partial [Candidatus Omnitrophica bacterium]|nr:flippase-like domain-containing protein [Candidatus Omnitrophota bacterium]
MKFRQSPWISEGATLKKVVSFFGKIIVTGVFCWLVLRKVNFAPVLSTLHSASLPPIILAYTIIIGLTFLLAWRWYLLLRGNQTTWFPFSFLWQMTMVGLFFNIFLPTGAGGDIARIFYLVRGQEKKLLLGSSVL